MAAIELRPEFQHTETGAGYINSNATALAELNDEVDAWPRDEASEKLKTLAVVWLGALSAIDREHWKIADEIQASFDRQAPSAAQRVALAQSSVDPSGWGMVTAFENAKATAAKTAINGVLGEIVSSVISKRQSKASAVANAAATAGRALARGIGVAESEADDVPDSTIEMLSTGMDLESRAMASGDACAWLADKIGAYVEQGSTKRLKLALTVAERVAVKVLDPKRARAKKPSASHYSGRLYELDPIETSSRRLLQLVRQVRDDGKPASIDAATSILERGRALYFALCGKDPRAIDLNRALWVDGQRRETDPFEPTPAELWMKRFVPSASTLNLPAAWGPPGWSPVVAKLSLGGKVRKPAPDNR